HHPARPPAAPPRPPTPAPRAASPATPAQLIHDRSSTVLPLPGGPDTTVTRACAASRPNSLGRETTPPAPGPATPPATESDPTAAPMFPIIDRDWARALLATEIAFASDVNHPALASDPAQDRQGGRAPVADRG